jgi:hypothetical protein
VRRKILIIASLLIVLSFFVLNFEDVKSNHPPFNALGWLWGGNTDDSLGSSSPDTGIGLGWISTDSANLKVGPSYGINVPKIDGPVTGFLWSSNLGWIDMQPSRGYPTTGCGGPCPSWASRREGNKLTGWARVLSIQNAQSSKPGLGNAGDWEGWIKLAGPGYGVKIDASGNIKGFGWSNELGSINFNARIEDPPKGSLTCSGVPDPAYLSAGGRVTWTAKGGSAPYSWTFIDSDANPKSSSSNPAVVKYSEEGKKTARVKSGTLNAECSVEVLPIKPGDPPSADIKANGSNGPITVPAKTNVTISWTSRNVTSCSILRNGSPWKTGLQNSGTPDTPPATKTTYQINCTGPKGSVLDSVVVNVSGSRPPLTCSGSPNPAYLSAGGIVTWSATKGFPSSSKFFCKSCCN